MKNHPNIAILTLQPHTNYGGILQAYALQTVLERLGGKAEIVLPNRVADKLPWFSNNSPKEIATIMQHTDKFIKRYLHTRLVAFGDINETDYDAYVVGSDQIWRYKLDCIMLDDFRHAFLDFTRGWNVRRISYAPSFGLDTWEAPESMIPEISSLLGMFSNVSVRESSGVDICRDILHRADAVHVVDPTMLLSRGDYETLIENGETETIGGTLACYVLNRDADKDALIGRIARTFSLDAFQINSRVEDSSAPAGERIQPPLEQWLRSFRDASMVVTDSFHATVFSILFRRPFIVTGNPGRGMARLQSILKVLGLEHHMVLKAEDFNPNCSYEIPDSVYEKLGKLRAEGLGFLAKALG